MEKKIKIGLVVQARMGSTRLPGKMEMPFYKQESLLEIILNNLKKLPKDVSIILATSKDPSNDRLEKIASSLDLEVHRGSENDVLQRFIDAADKYKLDVVIRVCADNPFLSVDHIKELIEFYKNVNCDYCTFAFDDGTPTIKSHIGVFTEAVSIQALRKVKKLTQDKFYFEHVTNYIYANPHHFECQYLPLPKILRKRKDIRLTIDTKVDFDNCKEIYRLIQDSLEQKMEGIIHLIDSDPIFLENMKYEIERNSK